MTTQGEAMVFPVSAPGANATAGELEALGKSMSMRAKDWNAMSQGSAKASAALGAMGASLGPLGAEFGNLGASVSRASGVIGNMTALLGGPLGIAIGVATAGLGVLIKSYADAAAEAEKLREEQEALVLALRDAGTARTKIATEAAGARDEAKLQADLSTGRATVEQYDAEIERLQRLAKATNDVKEATQSLGRAQNLSILRERAQAREAQAGAFGRSNADALSAIEEAEAEADARGLIGKAPGEGGRGGSKSDPFASARSQANKTQIENIDALLQASRDREAVLTGIEREAEAERAAIRKIEADQQIEESNRVFAARMETMQNKWADERAIAEERKRMHQELGQLQKGIAADVANASMRGINEVVKGNKIGAKAVVQSIGDALVARGTQAILEGTIFSATPFMWGSGAPMIAAGGAAITAGLALGAASRALPGGGGGGGGGGINPTTRQLGPASPVAIDRTGTGTAPSVINVSLSSTVAPSADDGERVIRAIQEAQRQGRV